MKFGKAAAWLPYTFALVETSGICATVGTRSSGKIVRFGKHLCWVALVIASTGGTACNIFSSGSLPMSAAAQRGSDVYQQRCAPCHDVDHPELLKQPPKLDGLFKKPTLPSGAPATDAEVRDVIVHGRGTMPAFDQTIEDSDINDIIQYLHTK